MTRNCWMSCNFWSNANAANSRPGKFTIGKITTGGHADVCLARYRRLAYILRSALLSAVGAGGSRVALAEGIACDGTEPGQFALRIAGSPADGFRCHYIRFCRAVVPIAGTPARQKRM